MLMMFLRFIAAANPPAAAASEDEENKVAPATGRGTTSSNGTGGGDVDKEDSGDTSSGGIFGSDTSGLDGGSVPALPIAMTPIPNLAEVFGAKLATKLVEVKQELEEGLPPLCSIKSSGNLVFRPNNNF